MTSRIAEPSLEQSTSHERPVLQIVRAVAAERDIEPIDVNPPLGRVVDTDALSQILDDATTTGLEVNFEYAGCHVVVTPDDVSVTRLPEVR
jgi:hypothetical protein